LLFRIDLQFQLPGFPTGPIVNRSVGPASSDA
jgi:hypothetical protein